MTTQARPDVDIEAMTDTGANRGRLEAIARFGAPAQMKAARAKVAAWNADARRAAATD